MTRQTDIVIKLRAKWTRNEITAYEAWEYAYSHKITEDQAVWILR